MAEYPACTEGALEKIKPYGLINDIGKELADEKYPYIDLLYQRRQMCCFVS